MRYNSFCEGVNKEISKVVRRLIKNLKCEETTLIINDYDTAFHFVKKYKNTFNKFKDITRLIWEGKERQIKKEPPGGLLFFKDLIKEGLPQKGEKISVLSCPYGFNVEEFKSEINTLKDLVFLRDKICSHKKKINL